MLHNFGRILSLPANSITLYLGINCHNNDFIILTDTIFKNEKPCGMENSTIKPNKQIALKSYSYYNNGISIFLRKFVNTYIWFKARNKTMKTINKLLFLLIHKLLLHVCGNAKSVCGNAFILGALSCKIFEPLGFTSRIQQLSSKLGSTPFKDGTTLAPKLADPLSSWKSSSTPFYTGSSILDLDWLIFCTI